MPLNRCDQGFFSYDFNGSQRSNILNGKDVGLLARCHLEWFATVAYQPGNSLNVTLPFLVKAGMIGTIWLGDW